MADRAELAVSSSRGLTDVQLERRGSGQWHAALRHYLGVIALGNLAWEFAQMPLYTIWTTGTWGEIVFAALHCTGGDILIALSLLMVALLAFGNGAWPAERFWTVAALTVGLGITYTIFSEWLNIVIRAAWSYSDLMPVLPILGFHVGLSPLLQWIVVPLAAFAWAKWRSRPRIGRAGC